MTAVSRAREGFAAQFGARPDGVVFAPGRVNLIGEHVDYNDGLVLPMPISAGTAIAWRRIPGDAIEVVALDLGPQSDRFIGHQPGQPEITGWRTYLRGMAAILRQRGLPISGVQLAVAGSLPQGAGLSSSASLCIALGRAFAAASAHVGLGPRELALAAQAAEHEWAGVHCGVMDQMVIAAGEPGAAFLLDCRDLTHRSVQLPEDWAVLIVQSGVQRELVDGHYNERRAACAAAAEILDVSSLREATLDMVEAGIADAVIRARARHVVTEIDRVSEAVACIAAGDLAGVGRRMAESHASLRDDFAVTVPAIDRLVETLQAAIGPQGGARMTGAGFGGAAVAICRSADAERVCAEVLRTYRCPAGSGPKIMIEPIGARCAGETR